MKTTKAKVSYKDLGVIISLFYFGDDQDFEDTEDLIDFLTSEENNEKSVVLTTSEA